MKIIANSLLSVAILATTSLAETVPPPSYQVTNEGDAVKIEAIDQPAASRKVETKASKTRKRIKTAPISELYKLYKESFEPDEQAFILETVSSRPPETARDIQSLLSFFLRNDTSAKEAAEASLQKLSQSRDASFAPYFLNLLNDENSKLRLFALIGINRLRPNEALETLYEMAKEPFKIAQPSLKTAPRPAEEWRTQLVALNVLADWQGEKALNLLLKRAKEAPIVAKLASTHCWEATLPKLIKWSHSKKDINRELSKFGWQANPPIAALKATIETLWKVLKSSRYDREIRHQAALKLGFAAAKQDVDRLLDLRSKAGNNKEKVLFEAALFASHDPRIIPILNDYVLNHPEPQSRAGALSQLSEMLEPEEYTKILIEMANNDPNQSNRDRAKKTLELSNK